MVCVNSVTVCPSEKTIRIGEWYYGASATVSPATATCKNVTWSSSNPAVASVNASSGAIYGLMPGTTKIYATAQDGSGRKDYCTITVSRIISVTSVSLNKSRITIENGSSHTLTATVYPENATNKTLSWTSDDEDVATVNDGVVVPRGKGTTKIRAIATDGTGKSASCTVTVTEDILVSSIEVSPSSKTMVVGDTDYLYTTVCPENATNQCVIWSSDDLSVATVNPESGLVCAQDVGTTAIRATAQDGSGKVGTCNLTVKPVVPVEEISICPNGKTMFIGETESLIATAWPGTATNKEFLWYSSDNNIASVDIYSGVVTAKGAGTATITVTTKDHTCSDTVTIKVLIDSVTIMRDYHFADHGSYNKVVFNSSGKVWHCINRDMLYKNPDEENHDIDEDLSKELNDRMNSNYFENYVDIMNHGNVKTYTDEEIKLLYAIDPYGVASYVNRYASFLGKDMESILEYKDYIFELLFNKKPKYFFRPAFSDDWIVTEHKEELGVNAVVSESDLVFGLRTIWDLTTFVDVCKLVFSIVGIFNETLGTALGYVEIVAKIGVLAVTGKVEYIDDMLISEYADSLAEYFVDDTIVSWANTWVSLYSDFNSLAQSINAKPNYYNEITNYYANKINYEVFVELITGDRYKMKDIHEAIV